MPQKSENLILTFRKKKLFGFLPLINLAGILLGALGGYAYFYFIGCRSGTCAITSNPWLSILWGMAVGYLIFDTFHKKESDNK